jgi:hypothetical protein
VNDDQVAGLEQCVAAASGEARESGLGAGVEYDRARIHDTGILSGLVAARPLSEGCQFYLVFQIRAPLFSTDESALWLLHALALLLRHAGCAIIPLA